MFRIRHVVFSQKPEEPANRQMEERHYLVYKIGVNSVEIRSYKGHYD